MLGTLSHDGELCAVALRRVGAVRGIGIDLMSLAERAGRVGDLAPMFVTGTGEMDSIATLNVPADPAMLLFSLKEAAIKALSFRLNDFIDMRAIEIRHADSFEHPHGGWRHRRPAVCRRDGQISGDGGHDPLTSRRRADTLGGVTLKLLISQ